MPCNPEGAGRTEVRRKLREHSDRVPKSSEDRPQSGLRGAPTDAAAVFMANNQAQRDRQAVWCSTRERSDLSACRGTPAMSRLLGAQKPPVVQDLGGDSYARGRVQLFVENQPLQATYSN